MAWLGLHNEIDATKLITTKNILRTTHYVPRGCYCYLSPSQLRLPMAAILLEASINGGTLYWKSAIENPSPPP
ncbi:unnamed protein product [Citrullus colocynthis]|uniref:Uncharacterized protein n=1 Tax=Citrullus colocynthis TaxID=252529 RepID=A0ABP0Z7D2_9ROSI